MPRPVNTATLALNGVPLPEGWTPENTARWNDVYGRLIRIEGGDADDPADRGGATRYGVSLRFLAIQGKIDRDGDGYGDFDLNRDGRIDALDVRLLTPGLCQGLYLRVFYIETGFWSLPRPFDMALFDQGVNGGERAAVKLLQLALNDCGKSDDLEVDGDLGPATRHRLYLWLKGGLPVLDCLRARAARRYQLIVTRDPSQAKFLAGWLRRAKELGRV